MNAETSPALPIIVRTVDELRTIVRDWRRDGKTVALLPTMGALHDGHLSLARIGLERCDRLITSIYVNPAQFAPHEDFDDYPRTIDDDLAKLADVGGLLVWAPKTAEMYPDGFATSIVPAGAAESLETEFRAHFFKGVATVCCKLFMQALPDIAIFGEKDYQQLVVIRQTVRDLNLPLAIVAGQTIREPDGLAMSSRNAYLDNAQRKTAPNLYRILKDAAAQTRAGAPISDAERSAAHALKSAGFETIDYVAIRNAETLQPATDSQTEPLRILAAAWLGKTRLIDNIAC